METYAIKDLSFAYPGQSQYALRHIDLKVQAGEFLVLCGPSGSGKSTLLRQLKTTLAPHGRIQGDILFSGQPLAEVEARRQAAEIGFVSQNPENQIVCDKVWHELSFGLESLGVPADEIRRRVAEMASFFGIQEWFYRNVAELSGGQKQLLNLASVMAMRPDVLILDEPTSQLDPISATDFLETVRKINLELGITVLLTEHRLEEVLPLADRLVVLDEGNIIADGPPAEVGAFLKRKAHTMFLSMPAPMRIYAGVENPYPCPVTVREGRSWLGKIAEMRALDKIGLTERRNPDNQREKPVLALKDVFFRYEKNGADILKGVSLQVYSGECYAVVGGNGTGKTTMLSVIGGINRPYRGKISAGGRLGVLPQNPQVLFAANTVEADLLEILPKRTLTAEERKEKVLMVASLCEITPLLGRHPYDLSGGEQQRAALAKVLLLQPSILLVDEPTKGMDNYFKKTFGSILRGLQDKGVTILMVSHDIEFCAEYADRCGMFFDGTIISENESRAFFSGNSFYTTAANRMAREYIPEAITVEDVIHACGRKSGGNPEVQSKEKETVTAQKDKEDKAVKRAHKLSKRAWFTLFTVLLAVPLTVLAGTYWLGDRKYYFISSLLLLEAVLPFLVLFENRRPQARELVVIAVLCALGIAGRTAFFMVPQFKAVSAVVVLAGVCLGAESGFLVGAVTMFVSNMFFGQGPWTPWQMLAMGMIGFSSGILFRKGLLPRKKLFICIYGGLAAFVIYGGIINPSSVLMFQPRPTKEMFYLAYLQALPFDLIHASSTVFFLWFITKPMLEKLERIKSKFGLLTA